MIKHVVCYKMKSQDLEELKKTKELLLTMKGRVPQVIDMEVGIDFLHSERSFDMILEVLLESKESMDAYQKDPYHVSVIKKHMHQVREKAVAVDFEI
ncbi:MAG: Dabb family protein [Erysipelotrichaceae bacterium]|nr:Dabb family protein [Erysipelotrichaceae bacterium]